MATPALPSLDHVTHAQQLLDEPGAIGAALPGGLTQGALRRIHPIAQFGQALALAAFVLGLVCERQRQGAR